MPAPLLRLAIVLAACLPAAALAEGPPLSATGSDLGVGVELAGLSRSYEVGGVAVSGQGAVGGVHAYGQWGAALRAEGRVLFGSIEYDEPSPSETGPVVLGEVRATIGRATENDARLYMGIGARHVAGDSPFGSGDTTSWLTYVPFGVSRAGPLHPGWRALVSLEGQLLLAGRDEIDDVAGVEDATFDRGGGWGIEVSAHARNEVARVGIEPYLRYMRPANSERETVGGSSVRISEAEEGSIGLRVSWVF